MIRTVFGGALSAILLSGCGGSPKSAPIEEGNKIPNVIFIVADDLGYGDISCYGAKRIQTPNVDRLAKQGLRFTDAHAVAATSTPSRYALFTGHYSWRRDDTGIAAGNAGMVIRPEQTTIADLFKTAGHATGAIGKWHLGLGDQTGTQDWNGVVEPGPRDLGFDYSYLMAATGDRVPCVWMENQKVANYDPSAPIEVSYEKPFPGEPLGKDHPELLTKLKPSPNHGHDQAIVNGISRIGYMKGGGKALWQDEYIADSSQPRQPDSSTNISLSPSSSMWEPTTFTYPVSPIPNSPGKAVWAIAATPSCNSTGLWARYWMRSTRPASATKHWSS